MKYYLFSALLLLAIGVQAQQSRVELNYVTGIPTGSMRTNVSDKLSGRGGELSLLFGLSDKLSVGVQAGFQDFYQKYPRQVYAESGTAISAVVTNSVQLIPIMAKVRYELNNTATVRPFVALAAGANLVNYNEYYGQFSEGTNSIRLAAQPSAGIHIPFGKAKTSGFQLTAGYNIMPFKYNGVDGLSHAVLKAGVTLPLR